MTQFPRAASESAARRPRKVGWVLGIIGAFLVGLVIGGVTGVLGGATVTALASRDETRATSPSATDDGTGDVAADPTDPADSFEFSEDTFTIKLKTLSKKCFGSAGCIVRVKPVLSAYDVASIPEDASGTLTYQITGDEDGPVIETIDLTGGQYSPEESSISTPSSGTKLKIKITDVENY